MEDYKKTERLYAAICKVDLGEFCLHHLYAICNDLRNYGIVWVPFNIGNEFAEFATHVLKRDVVATPMLATDSYYKAGMVQRIVLG